MNAPARAPLVPINVVVDGLTDRIESLARELLPHGQRRGAEWLALAVMRGEKNPSLSVRISGDKAGLWSDFGADISGDALDLVAYCRFGGDKKRAFAWAKSWLGLDNMDPARLAAAQHQAQEHQLERDREAKKDEERARNAALRMWLAAEPSLQGTPVDLYLVGRGIDLASLGRQPKSIRYHRDLWCVEAGRGLPAMITAINDGEGKFIGCHRTWLASDGPGRFVKAPLQFPKKTLGSWRGGFIRIWRGASGKPIARAPHGEVVDVTEGIEDGLSVAIAAPEARVIAAVNLGNVGNLVFPPQIDSLRVWKQNDTSPAAIAAFDKAVRLQLERGMSVLIAGTPEGVKDVNDLLRGTS